MIWALPFLVVVGLLLPWAAWSSSRHLAEAAPAPLVLPSAQALAIQTIAIQAVVAALAWLALAKIGGTVSWGGVPSLLPVLAAIGLVVVALALARWEARRPLGPGDQLRRELRSAGLSPVWILAMVAAAVGEEFSYRGVLSTVLGDGLPGGAAVLISASLFGLAHFGQGVRGAAISTVFALALQGLMFLGDGLLLPIVAHLFYDLGAAWLATRLVAPPAA